VTAVPPPAAEDWNGTPDPRLVSRLLARRPQTSRPARCAMARLGLAERLLPLPGRLVRRGAPLEDDDLEPMPPRVAGTVLPPAASGEVARPVTAPRSVGRLPAFPPGRPPSGRPAAPLRWRPARPVPDPGRQPWGSRWAAGSPIPEPNPYLRPGPALLVGPTRPPRVGSVHASSRGALIGPPAPDRPPRPRELLHRLLGPAEELDRRPARGPPRVPGRRARGPSSSRAGPRRRRPRSLGRPAVPEPPYPWSAGRARPRRQPGARARTRLTPGRRPARRASMCTRPAGATPRSPSPGARRGSPPGEGWCSG
jgi:hypothetical protein